MTHLEAIEKIETALTDLRLKDPDGLFLIGIESYTLFFKLIDFDSVKVINENLTNGFISVDDYCEQMLELIREAKEKMLLLKYEEKSN